MMDLVASYDSDEAKDSDIEEISILSDRSLDVDVIVLESDSENETTTKRKNIEVSSKRTKKRRLQPDKTLECIDLEEGEDEGSNKSPKRKSNVASSSENKKIDYLRIESSDSDIECQSVDDKLNNLINSASVLSDTPCGPTKPPETSCEVSAENTSVEKQHEGSVSFSKSSVDVNCSSNRSTPNSVQNFNVTQASEISATNQDFSQFKTGFTFETTNLKSNLNECESEQKVSCLFTEDERVIEASKKNVVSRIPRQIVQTHVAHSNIIMSLNWCISQYSHLFLSASLDCSVKIWDLYRKNPVQRINFAAGLNAAEWSLDGGQIIAGGNGKKTFVCDVQTGTKLLEYDIYNYVTSLAVHPYMEDIFLCGTRNAVLGFDVRVNTPFPIRSFFSKCEEVLSLAFLDEAEFICSTNIVSHDSADRTIMAWDFSSGALLSNQIYLERYTCPSLKVHPTDTTFVAQTNGNYIAAFSSSRPYKIKNKRYTGHRVSGYGIECDISPDGKYLASGDAEGGVYFYNYSNTSIVLTSTVRSKTPTNRLKWHPAFPSTLITSSYDGHIQIWK